MRPLRILALFGDRGQQDGRVTRSPEHEMHFSPGCLDDVLERAPAGLRVRRDVLEKTLANIETADVVFSDSGEAVLLRFIRSRRGRPPKPWLINEVDGLVQAREVAAFIQRHYREDPLRETLAAPEMVWFTITPGLQDRYRALGLGEERMFHLPMARASISFFFPEMVAAQERWLRHCRRGRCSEPGLRILALGSHARDWCTLVEALELSGLKAEVICHPAARRSAPDSGRIEWLGSLPPKEYLQAIGRASIVVLPLRDEGRAAGQMSCALPMRMGKALVATALPSLAQHVESGVTGLSVAPGDAASLARALRRLAEDPALRARLGEAAQIREAELSRVAAKTLRRILERLVPCRGGR